MNLNKVALCGLSITLNAGIIVRCYFGPGNEWEYDVNACSDVTFDNGLSIRCNTSTTIDKDIRFHKAYYSFNFLKLCSSSLSQYYREKSLNAASPTITQ